jgi:Tfp pilus assembly protein PilF|tara:strand:- start:6427 stop:6819 length:393 start_codon:yes stop_codon:yes gene_type:complete
MQLTIDEALNLAVGKHKEGDLEEAKNLYAAILAAIPLHPDANHNIGLLALSVNKADAALPFLKTALGANLKIPQFWLSYINALMLDKQFENAKQVLDQAKQQGVLGIAYDEFNERLASIFSLADKYSVAD